MTECSGCGGCCSPVAMPYTQDDVRRTMPGQMHPENRRWILEDLVPISRREGLARSPYMDSGPTFLRRPDDSVVEQWTWFFECRHYDPETRTCGNYEHRPPMCSGFPWYGDAPDRTKALPHECSFRADIGQPVTIGSKP